MSRYAEAIGIWELKVGGLDFDLKPQKGDNRRFRKILMDDSAKKDKSLLFDRFEDFMVELICRDYPCADEKEKEELKQFVEMNVNTLFEETMVTFRWSTKEQMEKAKKEALGDTKKLLGEV